MAFFICAPVYPRWRGEHRLYVIPIYFTVGLSPLARGTPVNRCVAVHVVRFIPAGAGNTIFLPRLAPGKTVYPRWRGEHLYLFDADRLTGGLSPLARGTPATTEKARQLIRFIPAGAGNTSFHLYFLMRIPVYPRWRGEHGEKYLVSRGITGLSPLARGTHCGSERQTRHHRFIPAGAGNTCCDLSLTCH